MDEIYFGDGDNVHLQYQSGRDDVRIMVLGMIYVIYIAISRRIHEQPIKEDMYRCLGSFFFFFLESALHYQCSDSLALLNLEAVPFLPLLETHFKHAWF